MELSRIPDIGPVHAGILAEAGLTTAADLAAVSDLEDLSRRTRVHPATLQAFQQAARAHVESILEAAGVHGPQDLAVADLDALCATTGLPRASLQAFQAVAREVLGQAAAPDAPAPPALPDRVILEDGRATARVSLGGDQRAGLAIVTLRMEEDEAGVLERAPGDAVLLKERAVTASARVGGTLHRDLPIYKERAAEGGGREEIRVRVTEIRDRPRQEVAPQAAGGVAGAAEPPRKKGFSLFRRGK